MTEPKFAVDSYATLADNVNVDVIIRESGLDRQALSYLRDSQRNKTPMQITAVDYWGDRWEYTVRTPAGTGIIFYENELVAHQPALTCAKDIEDLYG